MNTTNRPTLEMQAVAKGATALAGSCSVLVAVTLLMSILGSRVASAQETPALERLEVALWPEYDQPATLVLYRMQLSASVPLPTTIALPIPADVGTPHAVAKRVGSQLFNLKHERVVEGDTAAIHIKTDTRDLQLEYYVPIVKNGAEREVNFSWPGGLEIKQLAYEVQVPAGATDFVLTPAYTREAPGVGGLKHYLAQLGPLGATDKASIKITYKNESNALSVNLIKQAQGAQAAPVAPAVPAPEAQQPSPPQAPADSGIPWWVYVVGLTLALAWGVTLLSKKKG